MDQISLVIVVLLMFLSFLLFIVFLIETYLLIKSVKKEEIIPQTTANGLPGSTHLPPEQTGDQYTPNYADQTVPLDSFMPNFKKKVSIKFNEKENEDQITPLEEKTK